MHSNKYFSTLGAVKNKSENKKQQQKSYTSTSTVWRPNICSLNRRSQKTVKIAEIRYLIISILQESILTVQELFVCEKLGFVNYLISKLENLQKKF